MGCAFCARPRSEQPRWLCAWGVHCPAGLYIFITSPVLAAQLPRVTTRALSQVHRVSNGELISGCDTPGRLSTVQNPRKTWSATGSLLTVWWEMSSLGPRLQQPLALQLWLHTPASLPPEGEGLYGSQLDLLWYSLNPLF